MKHTKVVAFGGGHGLGASLRALKAMNGLDLTAVVTVGDDGGSSGSEYALMTVSAPRLLVGLFHAWLGSIVRKTWSCSMYGRMPYRQLSRSDGRAEPGNPPSVGPT